IPTYEQELLLKLLLAFVVGLLIGYERDRGGKPAGMRTQMLICVGSTLLAGISIHLGDAYVATTGVRPDPARLMAQILVGIGFVGAGVILKTSNRITGVTTAATLWLTAAIGIGIGSGFYASSILATIFILSLEPIAALKAYLGLKANIYMLQIPKKFTSEVEELMQNEFIKFHTDDTHENHVQFTIFTTAKKIHTLQNILTAKKLSFDLEETED
ncbi:MAG: MgtC/SapB family protein, partial [Patescibacteria group bacterium]|nr:MgtC/SapB family protein [Patescibacteria group bacterium]